MESNTRSKIMEELTRLGKEYPMISISVLTPDDFASVETPGTTADWGNPVYQRVAKSLTESATGVDSVTWMKIRKAFQSANSI